MPYGKSEDATRSRLDCEMFGMLNFSMISLEEVKKSG